MDTDLYRRIFTTHPHATILFGLIDGIIEDVNDSALALYGYERKEMIGLHISALSAEPEARLNKRKDGTILAIEAHRSVMNIDGREVGYSVIREISAASEVNFRRLADTIARDLNEIQTGIRGLTEASIKSLGKGDPARKGLEEVLLSSMRATKLTSPLLA